MLASEIVSKKVLSVYEAKYVGIVENVLINKRSHKLMFLKIYCETNNEYYLINNKNIYNIGNDAILIKNATCLHLLESMDGWQDKCYNPINTRLFDIKGNKVGMVCDIAFTTNNYVENIVVANKDIKLHAKNLLTIGKEICIVNSTSPKKAFAFAPKKKMPNTQDYKVSIITNTATQTVSTQTANTKQPKRIITDYQFLLNRKITSNIFSQNGELLLKKIAL